MKKWEIPHDRMKKLEIPRKIVIWKIAA